MENTNTENMEKVDTAAMISKHWKILAILIAAVIAAFFIFDFNQYLSLEALKIQQANIEAYRRGNNLSVARRYHKIMQPVIKNASCFLTLLNAPLKASTMSSCFPCGNISASLRK